MVFLYTFTIKRRYNGQGWNTKQICSVCGLNILLLHALCIKMHRNIPFPDERNQNLSGEVLSLVSYFTILIET